MRRCLRLIKKVVRTIGNQTIPFALPALFICLLLLQIRKVHHFYIMVIAGISSLFFKWALPGNWYIILTALLASGVGIYISSKLKE